MTTINPLLESSRLKDSINHLDVQIKHLDKRHNISLADINMFVTAIINETGFAKHREYKSYDFASLTVAIYELGLFDYKVMSDNLEPMINGHQYITAFDDNGSPRFSFRVMVPIFNYFIRSTANSDEIEDLVNYYSQQYRFRLVKEQKSLKDDYYSKTRWLVKTGQMYRADPV